MAWQIDTAHSQVDFSVRHMMISNVRGRFENLSGTVDFDENNPSNTKVDVKIEAASINTREAQRDGHLKSPDFLNVEQYPYLVFKGKNVRVLDSTHAQLVGDLTIRDVTHEVVLDVEFSGVVKSPFGNTAAGFVASTKINRKDWGLVWNVGLETGGVLVGDEIKVDIELELVKEVEQEVAVAGD